MMVEMNYVGLLGYASDLWLVCLIFFIFVCVCVCALLLYFPNEINERISCKGNVWIQHHIMP